MILNFIHQGSLKSGPFFLQIFSLTDNFRVFTKTNSGDFMKDNIRKDIALFCTGGLSYAGLELLWRQRTHWTMVLTGGACFLCLYKLYEKHPNLSTPEKCVLGSCIVTGIEFAVGCVVNLMLNWRVWDYSSLPMNLLGQVCLLYSVLWGALCIPISIVCRRIRVLIESLPKKKVRT